MTTTRQPEDRITTALERLDRKLDGVALAGARLSRIEHDTQRFRETVALKSDVMALGARIEGLSNRIDTMAGQVAATAPRLQLAEAAIGELRQGCARGDRVDGIERDVVMLADRIESANQSQTMRAAKLSSQMTGWLVSLILLIVTALVSYSLITPR